MREELYRLLRRDAEHSEFVRRRDAADYRRRMFEKTG